MDGFRLSLIVIGIVVILVIYIMGRRGESGRARPSLYAMVRPLLTRYERYRDARRDAMPHRGEAPNDTELDWEGEPLSAADDNSDDDELGIHVHTIDEESPAVPEGEEFILVLRILASRGARFNGLEVKSAAETVGMRHGDMDIFHLYTQVQPPIQPRVICSLANGIEPGHFQLEELESHNTPALTLFMQLPGPLDGRDAFEKMLELGRRLAQHLGGELYDESRSVLTAQTISHLREKLEAWRFRTRMAQIRKRHH